MRSTCGGVNWLHDDKKRLVGVSLGADASTEHECGTKKLAEAFGYKFGSRDGWDARRITRLPTTFAGTELEVNGEQCILVSSNLEVALRHVHTELRFYQFTKGCTLNTSAAWDEENFAILARGPDMKWARKLLESFAYLDVMAGGVLQSHYPVMGLTYAVYSRVPYHVKAIAKQKLDDELTRDKILMDSGVIERLINAGRRWYSLRETAWHDAAKTTIRVWLNPSDQAQNRSGWFTLEQLEQWVKGEGPVMTCNKDRAFQFPGTTA